MLLHHGPCAAPLPPGGPGQAEAALVDGGLAHGTPAGEAEGADRAAVDRGLSGAPLRQHSGQLLAHGAHEHHPLGGVGLCAEGGDQLGVDSPGLVAADMRNALHGAPSINA